MAIESEHKGEFERVSRKIEELAPKENEQHRKKVAESETVRQIQCEINGMKMYATDIVYILALYVILVL